MTDFLHLAIIPFVTVYHSVFVNPRLSKVEEAAKDHGELLARIDERTELMYNIIDKKLNGKSV